MSLIIGIENKNNERSSSALHEPIAKTGRNSGMTHEFAFA